MDQRLDKWLCYARFCKTRSLAQTLCASGHVHLNGTSVSKPSQSVKPGDELVLVIGYWRKSIRVLANAKRRGPAKEAQTLYEMLCEPENLRPPKSTLAQRDRGAGRPTKRERRAVDMLKGE